MPDGLNFKVGSSPLLVPQKRCDRNIFALLLRLLLRLLRGLCVRRKGHERGSLHAAPTRLTLKRVDHKAMERLSWVLCILLRHCFKSYKLSPPYPSFIFHFSFSRLT